MEIIDSIVPRNSSTLLKRTLEAGIYTGACYWGRTFYPVSLAQAACYGITLTLYSFLLDRLVSEFRNSPTYGPKINQALSSLKGRIAKTTLKESCALLLISPMATHGVSFFGSMGAPLFTLPPLNHHLVGGIFALSLFAQILVVCVRTYLNNQKSAYNLQTPPLSLPKEIQSHILEHLTLEEIGNCAQTCQDFKQNIEADASILLRQLMSDDPTQFRSSVELMNKIRLGGNKVKELHLSRKLTSKELEEIVTTCPNIEKLVLNGQTYIEDKDLPIFTKLNNLKQLELNRLWISSPSMATLANFHKLEHLVLNEIYYINCGALHHLSKLLLKHLEITHCSWMNDSGLAHLSTLPLEHLDLQGCDAITDAGLSHLNPFTLKHLNLKRCNYITDVGLNTIGNLIHLEYLNLSGLQYTDVGLAHIANLVGLKHLDLENNVNITGTGFANFSALTALKHMILKSCYNITDAGLMHLLPLTSIEHLNLKFCGSITAAGLGPLLMALKGLRTLILDNCPAATDISLVNLKYLTELQKLDLSDTKLTSTSFIHFPLLTKLRHLSICGASIKADDLIYFKDLTNLQILDLSNNPICSSAAVPDPLLPLGGLIHLKKLSLYVTGLASHDLIPLNNLTSLQILDLTRTGIRDEGISHLQSLKKLRKLYLGHTNVTVASLPYFLKMPSLKFVSLYRDRNSGISLLERLCLHLFLRHVKVVSDLPSQYQNHGEEFH